MPDQVVAGQLVNNPIGAGQPNFGGNLINNQLAHFATLNAKVPFDELPGYGESYDQKGNESRRILICDWEVFNVMPTEFLGDVQPGVGKLNRQIPEVHPARTWMYADDLSLREGRGAWVQDFAARQMISYKDVVNLLDGRAVFEVVYRPRSYNVFDNRVATEFQRWVTPRRYFSVDNLGLPDNSFMWAKDSVPIPAGIAIQRPVNELRYRWDWVPYASIPWQKINATVGRVNSVAFDGVYDDFAYPPGTVLCAAPQVSDRYFTPSGIPVVTVEYILLYRADSTWNQFYRRANPPGFQDVISQFAGQSPPYASADFSQLFVPGA